MLRRAPGKNRLVGVMPIAPRASVVGLHGPLGRKHNRRVVHPARPGQPVREGLPQAGAEW
jgi:hypothetical protein